MSIKIFKILIVVFLTLFVITIDSQASGQQRGNQSGFTVTHGPDFDIPLVPTDGGGYDFPNALEPKGYQSTATIEAKFYKDGVAQTITEPVTWTIEDVQNNAPSWNRASKAKNGLVWGDTVDPSNSFNYMWTDDKVGGTVPNGATIKLTDVVGQRTVTLKAETTINSELYFETVKVTFGRGPLSVFTGPPSAGGKQWATASGVPEKAKAYGDFTATSTNFPASEACGGTVHTVSPDITIDRLSYRVKFSTGDINSTWRAGSISNEYYSTTSKLPTFGQLLSVSAYNGTIIDSSNVKRKGAALAAGWPDSQGGPDDSKKGEYYYWTGQVFFGGFYFDVFRAVYIGLIDGDSHGGIVSNADPVVACVP